MTLTSLIKPVTRLAVMIGGELMQSALHFSLNIALIGVLSAFDFGLFAITLIIGGIGLTYIRALTAMPATIHIGRGVSEYRARFYDQMFTAAALVVSALIGLLTAAVLSWWEPHCALAGAIFVGFWCFRSHLRAVQFAFGRQTLPTMGDFAFAASGALLSGVAIWRGVDVLNGVFLALACANAIGAATMRALAGAPIEVSFNRRARLTYARLGRKLVWSAFSVTTTNIQGQGLSALVAGIAGPAAFAPIAVVIVAFTPLRIMGTSMMNAIQPEISRLRARGDAAGIWRQSRNYTLALSAVGMIYGIAVMTILPFVKVHALAGAPIHLIGAFAWAIFTMSLIYSAPRASLEVFMRFGAVAIVMSVAAVTGMTLIALLLRWATPGWALAGAAVGEAIVTISLWALMIIELNAMNGRRFADISHPFAYPRPRTPASSAL